MKKIFAVAILAASLSLGACATTGGASLTSTDITNFEDAIIADVIAGCQIEPSLASVLTLISDSVLPAASAVTTVAATLATTVCTAAKNVTPAASSARSLAGQTVSIPVVVNGKPVLVTGHRV